MPTKRTSTPTRRKLRSKRKQSARLKKPESKSRFVLHALTGLPRAASTLFQNILNQNPVFHATSTSGLCGWLSSLVQSWSNSPEMKGLLHDDHLGTQALQKKAVMAFVKTWCAGNGPIIFDKSRGWCSNTLIFKHLFPGGKQIVMVRDLRNVFASIEKQHRENPLLDEAKNPAERTIFERANQMFSPQGLIGGPLAGIQDLLNRNVKNALFVQSEELAEDPKDVMETVYKFLGLKPFKHNFKSVQNTACDPDHIYNYKYPHEGSGKVRPSDPDEWKKFFSRELAATIMQRFPWYNRKFGYM